MTVTIFSESIAASKALGLYQVALGFGKPFETYHGRLVRLTIESLDHWNACAESKLGKWYRPQSNLDNHGAMWQGFNLGKWFCFRHYRLCATHLSFGPFTLSICKGTWGPTAYRFTWGTK